jgi:aspartyl-tRNA(Asn)/glutamyl-tRNA(Gln) amidotransferase subunit C
VSVKIDQPLVRRVAELANLELSDEEVAYYEVQLQKILTYVADVEAVKGELPEGWRADTERQPTSERPDVVRPPLGPEAVLANAPETQGTAFRVPRIIE